MFKSRKLCLLICLFSLVCAYSFAVISAPNRVRVIFDMLIDGTVQNEGSYELAPATMADKYADAFWTVYDGTNNLTPGTPVPTPTNAQKGQFVIKRLKMHILEVYDASQSPAAGAAAVATKKAQVTAEVTADIGAP